MSWMQGDGFKTSDRLVFLFLAKRGVGRRVRDGNYIMQTLTGLSEQTENQEYYVMEHYCKLGMS